MFLINDYPEWIYLEMPHATATPNQALSMAFSEKKVDQQGHKNWKTTGKMPGESYQFMDDRLQYPPNSLGRCV